MIDQQKILVLGANGQLGRALKKELPDATFYGRQECDLADTASLEQLDVSAFEVVINAAAYTAVDAAETAEGKALAHKVNTEAVKILADLTPLVGCIFVHVSTDYVFDGTSEMPYLETDEFAPLGEYAKSKANGDLSVLGNPRHYIVRTSWVIGDGNNFVKTMATLADRGLSPKVVNDQIGRLTFTQDLAAGITHLLQNHAPFGTYNLSNEGPASSWADIAKQVFQLSGRNPEDVVGVSTQVYFEGKEGIAPRPLWSMLDLAKIESTEFFPESWEKRLVEYLS